MLIQWRRNKKGISIVEILIVIAIVGIGLTSLLGVAVFSLKRSIARKETVRADALAQDTIEVVRNFRDGTTWDIDGLGTLITGISYYPQKTGDTPPEWTLIQGEEQITIFSRKVVFGDVRRDANDDIVVSGGTNDPDTRRIIVTISWKDKESKIITYLTNWK